MILNEDFEFEVDAIVLLYSLPYYIIEDTEFKYILSQIAKKL